MNKVFILILTLCIFHVEVDAASKVYTRSGNLAVEGYDVTTFFESGGPQMGSSDHELSYDGATWHFINEENLELFKDNPETYTPQYGGYCIMAISQGRLTGGSTEHWIVFDGDLYLLCNQNALNNWLKSPYFHIWKADSRWPQILSIY